MSFQYIYALFDSSEFYLEWHLHAFVVTRIHRLSRDNYFTWTDLICCKKIKYCFPKFTRLSKQ